MVSQAAPPITAADIFEGGVDHVPGMELPENRKKLKNFLESANGGLVRYLGQMIKEAVRDAQASDDDVNKDSEMCRRLIWVQRKIGHRVVWSRSALDWL